MSLRTTIAALFRSDGRESMDESEFVVGLSLDRDWFSPDQAKRLVTVAVSEGLLTRQDGDLTVTFSVEDVPVPDGFVPDEDVLRRRSTFERVLDTILETGAEKQETVAAINRLQGELDVTLEAAAVVYARRSGIDVSEVPMQAGQGV